MDPVTLARVQFGLTISYHYLFPVLTIGLSLLLVIMEGLYLKTGNETYHKMTHFWVSVFTLIFAMGAATGLVMEFQFGTNWSNYSRFMGDAFGRALSAEGLFAFFLESVFLAVLVFGWDKIGKLMHFLSTILVCVGTHFSAIWIVITNSWQQTPAGFHIVSHNGMPRVEVTDFWQMVFNPSSVERLIHVVLGAWLAGAFLVLSVSAFYLIKGKNLDMARAGMRIGLVVATAASLLQLFSGHEAAWTVSRYQPVKLAAMEGHFHSGKPASLHLLGWVDERKQQTSGIEIPGGVSFLSYGDFNRPMAGLDKVPQANRPPSSFVFQFYHLMVAVGAALIGLSLLACFLWWRGTLFQNKPVLWLLVFSVLLPQIANQMGWFTAEMGRQPWVVYGLLRTSQAISPSVRSTHLLASIMMFSVIYLLLFALFIFLLDRKIRKGPVFAVDDIHQASRLAIQSRECEITVL